MINGEYGGNIHPTRGIQQGDALSPYLFLLCSKGLNVLIQREANMCNLIAFSLCKHGPRTSHLFFANDSLLFCCARLWDIPAIQNTWTHSEHLICFLLMIAYYFVVLDCGIFEQFRILGPILKKHPVSR